MTIQQLEILVEDRPKTRIQAKVFDGSAPGANTDILPAHLTPKDPNGSIFRIVAAFENATVFNLIVKEDATTHVIGLNSNVAIPAQTGFAFALPVHPDLSYNFQIETDGATRMLLVNEVSSN